jgi:uncharacterized protein with GYD domain
MQKGGFDMATFVMSGKYSSEALTGISAKRTEKAVDLIKRFGGEVLSMYVLLGQQDLLLIVEAAGIEQALQISIALNRTTGISFTTAPALTVEEFDKMMSGA